jgi:hypothetical protein
MRGLHERTFTRTCLRKRIARTERISTLILPRGPQLRSRRDLTFGNENALDRTTQRQEAEDKNEKTKQLRNGPTLFAMLALSDDFRTAARGPGEIPLACFHLVNVKLLCLMYVLIIMRAGWHRQPTRSEKPLNTRKRASRHVFIISPLLILNTIVRSISIAQILLHASCPVTGVVNGSTL